MATEAGLGYTLYPPRSWTSGRKYGQPTVIFIHTTEGGEGPTSAEDGAAYDARRTDGTSTHFFADSNSVVQCVRTTDEAHAARAHGNDVGIQIEICGRSSQSDAQWADPASAATIEQAARLCVKLRAKYRGLFPLVNLTPTQLRAGRTGFAEHLDATLAWPEDYGTHTDPGPRFPWSKLFARITELEHPKGWDEMATKAEVIDAARVGAVAAFLEKIPFAGAPGARIHAEGWADLSVAERLDYLCEIIMTKERAEGQSGAIMSRLDRIETAIENLAQQPPAA